MKIVGSYELKTNLAKFLTFVIKGESIDVTKNGILIAKIIPAEKKLKRYTKKEAITEIRKIQRVPLKGCTIREIIEKGRNRHTTSL